MFLGAAVAASVGPIAWSWLALTVIGIFFLEAAKNASGEAGDFDSGADLAVATVYGPLIACGTYIVQRGAVSAEVIAQSMPLGLAIGAFLWINVSPPSKRIAAPASGLSSCDSDARASRVYCWLVASVAISPLTQQVSYGAWGGLIGLPHAFAAARWLRRSRDTTASAPKPR